MNAIARTLTAVVSFVGLVACSVTSVGPAGGSPSGATSEQLSRCHDGCDKMKFFECSSAAELSACYSDCDSSPPKAIDVFVACAENSICDPACRTNIKPAPSSSGSSSSGAKTTTTGGGASASSCQAACDKLITTCNFAPVGQMQTCLDACTQQGYQYQIDCVANNQCGDIKSRCGSVGSGAPSSGAPSGGAPSGGAPSGGAPSGGGVGTGGSTPDVNVVQCQFACDSLLQRTCISASEQSTCRTDCTSITGSARDTFMACAQSAAECPVAHDCFSAFAN